MTYSVQIKGSALKEINSIPEPMRQRQASAINQLGEQPFAGHPLRGNLIGLHRYRVGDYRIVYELQNEQHTVRVIGVVHRSKAYRRR